MEPSYFLPAIVVAKTRTSQQRLKLYADDGSPATFDAGDEFRFKVWAAGNASPVIDADEGTATSRVEVISNGVANTTPAEIICHFHETETTNLTAGSEYYWEILVYDSSATVNRSIAKGPVIVEETTGGSLGA